MLHIKRFHPENLRCESKTTVSQAVIITSNGETRANIVNVLDKYCDVEISLKEVIQMRCYSVFVITSF